MGIREWRESETRARDARGLDSEASNIASNVLDLEFDNMDDYEINLSNATLMVDSRQGVYAPQIMAEIIRDNRDSFTGINDLDLSCVLAGPDAEGYWDAWHNIESNAVHESGATLYQDGDIWLVPQLG